MSSHSPLQVPLENPADLSGTSKTSGCTRYSTSTQRSHKKSSQSRSRGTGTVLPDSTTTGGSRGTHRKPSKWSVASSKSASSPVITPLMSCNVKLQELRVCDLRDVPKVLQLWSKVFGPLQWNQKESIPINNSIRLSLSSGLSSIMEDVRPNGEPFISGCILATRLTFRDFEISTLMSPNYWFNAQVYTSEWQTMMWLFNHHMAFLAHMMFVFKEALFITLPLVDPSVTSGDMYEACLLYTKMFFNVVSNAQLKGLKMGLFIANGNLQKNVARNAGFLPLTELPLPLGSIPVPGEPIQETLSLMVRYPHTPQQ